MENPEFIKLLNYVRLPAPPLEIPGQNVIKHSVMKMGEDGIQETREMFAVGSFHFTLFWFNYFYRRRLARFQSLLIAGRPATCMHFLPLWPIISMSTDSLVGSCFSKCPPTFAQILDRGASH